MAPTPVETELPSPVHPNLLWRFCRFVLRLVFAFWLNYRVRGLEHIPRSGGGLVVSNHLSYLDPLLIGLPLQRIISYVARDDLFRVPVVGWILRKTYVMPINRKSAGSAVIRESSRRMQQGFLVGIFPEGTRSTTGEVAEFKPGFLALIKRASVPIYPTAIAGADRVMPRGRLTFRPRPVRVVFGRPLLAEEIRTWIEEGRERELVDLIHDRILDCRREAVQWLDGTGGGSGDRNSEFRAGNSAWGVRDQRADA